MGVRGQDEGASVLLGQSGQVPIEVLAARETIDFKSDIIFHTGREDEFPTNAKAWTSVKMTGPGVGQDVDIGAGDRPQQPLGLITIWVEVAVDGGNDTVQFLSFGEGNIDGTVFENLDLEALEETEVFAELAIPAIQAVALEADALVIEPRGDFEASGVVGNHRPGRTLTATFSGHGLEGYFAVRVGRVPMKSSPHPLWMEVGVSLGNATTHVHPGQIVLPCASPAGLAPIRESLSGCIEGIRACTLDQLGDQRPEPRRGLVQDGPVAGFSGVKNGVACLEVGDAPVTRGLHFSQGKECLGQIGVGCAVAVSHRVGSQSASVNSQPQ